MRFFLLLAVMILTSCEQKITYDYLMHNPTYLNTEIARCQNNIQKDKQQIEQCDIVMSAKADFVALLTEQQQDPEKFGLKILDAEITMVNTKKSYVAAKLKYKNNPSSISETDLTQLKKQFDDNRNEVKTLLAVIGINSPE